jgi:hypothetical protein
MTSFKFFELQTVFIGGRGMIFHFFEFSDLKQSKNDQIYIQMVNFLFK